jgi:ferredoxin-NADP reductase
MTEFVTHDVKRFIVQRPVGFSYVPGQSVLVAIKQHGLENDFRPFTPTSLAEDNMLEFTIKQYPHGGMTEKLHNLKAGDELLLGKVFGTIQYKGPGVFIAGGIGITPFIAILRHLYRTNQIRGNSLIFSSKTRADIILEKEFAHYLGADCVFTLTRQSFPGYHNGRIDRDFLTAYVKAFNRQFYLCGPQGFVTELTGLLKAAGAKPENIVS